MTDDSRPNRPSSPHLRAPVARAARCTALLLTLTLPACVALPCGAAGPLPEPRNETAPTGRWMGRSEAFGYPMFIECLFDGRGGGTIRGFAEAPMGFDALTLPPVPVAGASLQEDELRFEATVRDRSVAFEASVQDDRGARLARGSARTRAGSTPFHLVRVAGPLDADRAGDLVGVYDLGAARTAITWREYGDLRMIDLDTGRGATLVPLAEGHRFTTRRSLLEPSGAQERIELRVTPSGARLLWVRPGDGDLEGHRTETISQERIRFRSGPLQLAGTLILPAGPGPHPAVVHVHGSGPIYRTALFQRAVLFAELGVASLVYDKRGTGASEGRWRGDVFKDLADDARAALDAARSRPEVDAERVGYAGHSQAGYVIPMASLEAPRPAFAVIVNGGSIRPGDQSLYDKEHDLRRAGFSADESEQALDLMRRIFEYVEHRRGDRAELERDYLAAKDREWFPVTDLPDIPAIPSWDDPPDELFRYRDELTFDPVPHQESMGMPVLVLLGAADETVPAGRAARIWTESLRRAGSEGFRIVVVGGADHAMRRSAADGTRRLAPEYRALLEDWLGQVL